MRDKRTPRDVCGEASLTRHSPGIYERDRDWDLGQSLLTGECIRCTNESGCRKEAVSIGYTVGCER